MLIRNQKGDLNNQRFLVTFFKNKKGDLALSNMGKIIIALVALLVLLYLISIITGEFESSGEKTKDVFSGLS